MALRIERAHAACARFRTAEDVERIAGLRQRVLARALPDFGAIQSTSLRMRLALELQRPGHRGAQVGQRRRQRGGGGPLQRQRRGLGQEGHVGTRLFMFIASQ
jgi:hypothetical protein